MAAPCVPPSSHDLLNELRQAQGDWDSAISLAEAHDRIHLRTTHYVRARGLEAEGMTDTAIEHYQKAGTHRTDVPRMLFDLNRTSKLLEYIDGRKEPELYKWWAQYCESHGQFDRVRGAGGVGGGRRPTAAGIPGGGGRWRPGLRPS